MARRSRPAIPLAVRRLGVSVVHQEFTLVPDLDVVDNVFLGRERGRPFLRRAEMARAVRARLDELGVDVDVHVPVGQLSVAQQQLVEIARALELDAAVLVLDEPSASLSAREVTRLLTVVRRAARPWARDRLHLPPVRRDFRSSPIG